MAKAITSAVNVDGTSLTNLEDPEMNEIDKAVRLYRNMEFAMELWKAQMETLSEEQIREFSNRTKKDSTTEHSGKTAL